MDSENWTEMDRQTDNNDFNADWATASFTVSKSVECRFIRLTRTGKTHGGDARLSVHQFELFGTLLESQE
jgi:hypothetical protein